MGVTCNGGGNHRVDTTEEKYKVLEHLSLSGIIDEQYKYEDGADTSQYNYISKIKEWNAGGTIAYSENSYTRAGHNMFVSSYTNSINVADIVKIDKKMDDGKASSGNFMSLFYNLLILFGYTPCVNPGVPIGNGSTVTTSNYVLSEKYASCVMLYEF